MRAIALILALCLAGCARQTIKEQMGAYVGQPVGVLISRLGYPTGEQVVAGAKVYVWVTTQLIEGTSFQCKIRAIVDARDIVTTWDFEGNEGGCRNYASLLR